MQIQAVSKSVRVAPRKMRLIADLIRNKTTKEALSTLVLIAKRAALPVAKTLKSAISNAIHNGKANEDNLIIKSVEVTEGLAMKRFHPSTRGRVHPYKKRGSNIKIVLEERSAHGTKN